MNKLFQLKGVGVKLSSNNNLGLISSFVDRYIKKFIAFTLAETLIVMGIIGVVAALTIPNLNSSTGDAEKVAKVKKIYAELNEAQNRAVAKYGPVGTWFVNDADSTAYKNRYFDRITKFMKIQKACKSSANGCSGQSYYIDGAESVDRNMVSYLPQAILSSGTAIIEINILSKNCSLDWSLWATKNSCGDIMVDIDGPNKGKNSYGRDIFSFAITKEGILPRISRNYMESRNYLKGYIESKGNGNFMTAWILENGNMDYLKVNHDENTPICPNNNQELTWERGSCK